MLRPAVACLLLAVAGAAEDSPSWSYTVTYQGKPVAGAKVALVEYAYVWPGSQPRDPIFTTADENGVARFPRTDPGRSTFARLLARDRAGRGGIGTLLGDRPNPASLELHDTISLTGRVTGAAGRPVPGLTLKTVALGPEKFRLFYGRQQVDADTPDWFWEAFPVRPAADGSFTLGGVPAGHSVAVRFAAPGFGSGRFWMVPGQPTSVMLAPAGAIALRFAASGGAKSGDVRVTATRTAAGAGDILEATATGTAAAGAELTLDGLPPGTYQVAFPSTGPAALFPRTVTPIVVKPGEATKLSTRWSRPPASPPG